MPTTNTAMTMIGTPLSELAPQTTELKDEPSEPAEPTRLHVTYVPTGDERLDELRVDDPTHVQDRPPEGEMADPFTMAFVYPKGEDPVVVKGWLTEVKELIEYYAPASIVRYAFFKEDWYRGKTVRGYWRFTTDELTVAEPHAPSDLYGTRRKYQIKRDGEVHLSFRDLPKKWLSEYDELASGPLPAAELNQFKCL